MTPWYTQITVFSVGNGMIRPELFPALLQKLQSPDVLLTQRVYLVLNQALKELSTKRLAADQRNFAEVLCRRLVVSFPNTQCL